MPPSPAPHSAHHHGQVFDRIAADYDRSRWSYPEPLLSRACAALAPGDPVLEIGCGTGQLTRSLLARGLTVTAVEPGANLAALAAQNLHPLGPVTFVHARFEDALLPDARYRALFSASAFHWIDPATGWHKAARLLAPGGTFALLQYCALRQPDTCDDDEAFLSAFRQIAPDVAALWPPSRDLDTFLAGADQRRSDLSGLWSWIGNYRLFHQDAGRLFSNVQIATLPIHFEQTAEQLFAVFATTSFCARLSAQQRAALERACHQIQQQRGRPLRSSTLAVLATATAGF